MSEFTAGELCKILEEHGIWIGTDKKEGKRADLRNASLRDADLSEVLGLNIEQLSEVKTCMRQN